MKLWQAILCASLASSAVLADTAEQKLVKKGFSKEWVQSLTEKGTPRIYTGEELKNIGMPVGGIYAGQMYISGDGRLWNWDIFNERVMDPGRPGDKYYLNAMKPEELMTVASGFLIDYGKEATQLSNQGFNDISFRGEYPISKINFKDDKQPLAVTLEAFSPFCPTEDDNSSIPATIFNYKLTNTSDKDVSFRVGGWLENASNRKAVNAGLLKHTITPILSGSAIWLNAESRVQVKDKSNRPDKVVMDFENGYGDWKAEGKAFQNSPFVASQSKGQNISNHSGKKLVNSYNTRVATGPAADNLTGTLTSPEIEINRNFLTFKVGGGKHDMRGVGAGVVGVEVLVDGDVIKLAQGKQSNRLQNVIVDLTDYQGKKLQIRVVDSQKGSWAIVLADDFLLTDKPKQESSIHADTGSMALALLGNKADSLEAVPVSWKNTGAKIPTNSALLQTEKITLSPGESTDVRFAVCWYFPNGHLGFHINTAVTRRQDQRNYYDKFYDSAADVAKDLDKRHEELVEKTRLWRDTWYDSNLPTWFLDRTFFNTSTLASASVQRFHDTKNPETDGRVYFWEGVYRGVGTCTHVSHYEQAFGRIFPDSARAQRSVTDYNIAWEDRHGYTCYRAENRSGGNNFGIPYAFDGATGTITRTYREHTTAPDNSFLKTNWPRIKRAAQFMIDQDAGRGFFTKYVPKEDRNSTPDGIITGPQYNTLDKTWDGVLPWMSGMYQAAMLATAEMATDMGDTEFAAECSRIAELGKKNLVIKAFNPDFGYYVQRPVNQDKYVNSNDGCHIDQMLGDYWANQIGLKLPFPTKEGNSALQETFDHNFHKEVGVYQKNAGIKIVRTYALEDEPGCVMVSFPHGGSDNCTPKKSFRAWDKLVLGYFSESWTGQEYPLASAMINRGLLTEGLAICKAVDDRYAEAPLRRNPFNEIEYGNHYTRAMSGYAPFISISGFKYHGPRKFIGFAPKMNKDNFKSAFVAGQSWGSYSQKIDDNEMNAEIMVKYGKLSLKTIELSATFQITDVDVSTGGWFGGQSASFTQEGDKVVITLKKPVDFEKGDKLKMNLK